MTTEPIIKAGNRKRGSRKWIHDGVWYTVVFAFLLVSYALLVSGVSLLLFGSLQPKTPILPGAIVFLLALLLLPVRDGAARFLNRVFRRGETVYEDSIKNFSQHVEQLAKIEEITTVLGRHIMQDLAPLALHIYCEDPIHKQYAASRDSKGQPTSELRFAADSPFVHLLKERQGVVFLGGSMYEKKLLQTDRTRLMLLGVSTIVPLQRGERLLGWIGLAPRAGAERLTSGELKYLDVISSLAAQAIERTRAIASLEERVRHLNILTRVSQGINITITRDDILELIYAQTTQLVPASDLSILVWDHTAGEFLQVFCVQNDERLESEENKPVLLQQRLESVVIQSQQAFLTQRYERECGQRGIQPYTASLSAWLSVPLLSGAETIGALTVGRRDMDGVYTQAQVELLEAIADQVAGALEKTRLLTETERRAQQLSSLNEVSRRLTSNLDFDPLLQNILESAVQILQCEAGLLLLADEDDEGLVLKATSGALDERQLREHLQEGGNLLEGLRVGRSSRVQEARTLIDWRLDMGRESLISIRSLLVAPLLRKEKTIGAIEVFNKLDQPGFSSEDEELLTAFAAQASISIENARLYTLTDQKLEARVKELSVLQRVGRELNATLDTRQAMEITLKWALAQSTAEAGLVALYQDGKIRVVAEQGLGMHLKLDEEGCLLEETEHLYRLIAAHRPQSFTPEGQTWFPFSPEARQQIFIPLERESICTGLLILESSVAHMADSDMITFLQRLVDHASISIANAQLYSAVQKANLAKSEFVSFVSHELKNPMTSIKGYTELIAAGAVGPVNEAQQNFLMTIRSNVDRMATLVSDLADESRIEAGRLRLDFAAIKLRDVFDEVIRSEGKLISEKKLTLQMDIQDPMAPVWADHTRLVQIISNLVSNARKYTPDGGHISVQAKESANQWDPEGARLVALVSIQDDGLGIKPEEQDKIFQKFFRSDEVKIREFPGTGLGLNITRSLVEAQGGRIWFHSEYRHGATFYFTIPLAQL